MIINSTGLFQESAIMLLLKNLLQDFHFSLVNSIASLFPSVWRYARKDIGLSQPRKGYKFRLLLYTFKLIGIKPVFPENHKLFFQSRSNLLHFGSQPLD